ncbi:hypothetical protein [Sediminitomix flava]|uniref:Uncharacterized protein n=1 Tax=Sediminitomix flava TaxID=379075 RepID=A0A315Z7Z5_SEDFL|nr:hypothetical protein [Sediminitomix flava]PWJ40171.1 hypothetical protein BC781_105239 [Sediminitomix flava]
MKKAHLTFLLILLVSITNCSKSAKNNEILDRNMFPHSKSFGFRFRQVLDQNHLYEEASGLCLSNQKKGLIWIHNDSDGENALFLINPSDGSYKGKLIIEGISNRDWEDICSSYDSTSKESIIYIADIGDNQNIFSTKYIYEIEEPKIPSYNDFIIKTKVKEIRKFFYPKDPHQDAESIFINPEEQRLYIINKNETVSSLYSIDLTLANHQVSAAKFETLIPLNYITSADYNSKRNWLILRNYNDIFLWKKDSIPFDQVFQSDPIRLVNKYEPQGEGICWNEDATGYFTIHEQGKGMPVGISFYKELQDQKNNATPTEGLPLETSKKLESYDN